MSDLFEGLPPRTVLRRPSFFSCEDACSEPRTLHVCSFFQIQPPSTFSLIQVISHHCKIASSPHPVKQRDPPILPHVLWITMSFLFLCSNFLSSTIYGPLRILNFDHLLMSRGFGFPPFFNLPSKFLCVLSGEGSVFNLPFWIDSSGSPLLHRSQPVPLVFPFVVRCSPKMPYHLFPWGL